MCAVNQEGIIVKLIDAGKTVAAATLIGAALPLVSAGIAHASPGAIGPHTWCPGQHLPAPDVQWDMSVCHTFYTLFGDGAKGNVGRYTWDGDNPPVDPAAIDRPPNNCGLFFCADPGGH
jgi:hypothetical protein